ncbi:hypothetical protein BSL78_20432 [Apostichopus japonicus]|uniref:vitamin-K-epoxide reductase (warfarin-sensitive) n=1 Tax=Stichopus japonicus TaxID=307972 RepID=A0A2G8K3X9_STIJA|nr:hypothetical protein BSL78_20432 [Apostichopus japonicus]
MPSRRSPRSLASFVQVYSGFLLCIIGIVLSLYAFHVETKKETDQEYTALCDISDRISCSKVFTSKYGRGFGLVTPILGEQSFLNVPNSIYGLIFYSLQMYLCTVHTKNGTLFQLLTSVISLGGCAYLAFILYFVLEDACIVCISTYIVNILLFLINVWKWSLVSGAKRKSD